VELAAGLASAHRLLAAGKSDGAIEACRSLLASWPDSADALRCIGLGLLQKQQLAEAEQYFLRASRLAPTSASILNDLGIVRLRRHAHAEALGLFARALELDPQHVDAIGNLAIAYSEMKQPDLAQPLLSRLIAARPFSGSAYARAARNRLALGDAGPGLELARRAVRNAPELVEARLALAAALEITGRFRQAKFQYLCVLDTAPHHPGALASLLSLRQGNIEVRHLQAARRAIDSSNLTPEEDAQLNLALARYHDYRGEYDTAFVHLERGNTLVSRRREFDVALFAQAIDSLITTFSAESMRGLPAGVNMSRRPIFIVGMPRSGTTLVEQILASHSSVVAGGELATMANLAADVSTSGEPYPMGIRRLDRVALERLATRYLERLGSISDTAQRVTDKMPFNFLHIGLLAVLFPEARVIHCRRDAIDTCLSCHFTSFSDDLKFASDLTSLGRYYVEYRRLMDHWFAVLPGRILDLDYEQVVARTEDSVKLLLEWCDLEFEPACLRFHRTVRGVHTPSRWQVRQPIYSHSVGRWRAYRGHLQPLLAALEPVLHARPDRRDTA